MKIPQFLLAVSGLAFISVSNAAESPTVNLNADREALQAYYLALNAQAPDLAKLQMWYQEQIERKCRKALAIEDVSSENFAMVPTALTMADAYDQSNNGGTTLLSTVQTHVGRSINCSDFSAPVQAMIDDHDFAAQQPKFNHMLKMIVKAKREGLAQ